MKIGIDISQIVYKGGVATYTQNLVKSLLTIDEKNSYVLFGSSFRKQDQLRKFLNNLPHNKNFTKKILPFPPLVLDILWNKIHKLSIEQLIGAVDIIHSSDWTQPPSKAKKITTIHDLTIFKYPEIVPKRIIEVHKRKLSWVKKECDLVIADSYCTKEDIVHYLKIPSEKIHVIYLGVDSSFYPQDHNKISEIKDKYGIDGEYILAFGAPGFRKNIDGVIKAFKRLQKKIPHNLVIIGGEEQNSERIINLKIVPLSDLPAFFTGASCFVYPSFYEGFGLPVLEAMACGCLVVSSNKGSLKEIIGDSVFVTDPKDSKDIEQKIQEALNLSDNEYQERINRGFKNANKFTWENTARETLKVYEEVV